MAEEKETITLKKSTVQLAGVFVVALLIGYVLGGYVFNPKGSSGTTTTTTTAPSPGSDGGTQPSRLDMKVLADDDPLKGDKNAPVVIVEFSDFQCPFCRRFYIQTLSQIEKEYVDTGKVLFVYRDFPLNSIHPAAQKSAEAAECADEQGKFWEFHNALFDEQNKQGAGTVDYNVDDIKTWASTVQGLDTAKFNECLDSGKYEQEVNKDFQDGVNAGVGGTPTFYINGQEVSGAQPFSVFKQVIDQQLAK